MNRIIRKRAEKIVPTEHLNTDRKGSDQFQREENDKLVIIENVHIDNVRNIVGHVCNLSNQQEFVIVPRIVKIKEDVTAVYFPYNISFDRFCGFINYLYFPIGPNFNYEPIIAGWTTTKLGDKWITESLENQRIMIYCDPEDREMDDVYLVTSGNVVYKCSFLLFKKKAIAVNKIMKYREPNVNMSYIEKMEYEELK